MVPSQHSVLKGAFEWIVVVAIALVATFLIRSFVVEPLCGAHRLHGVHNRDRRPDFGAKGEPQARQACQPRRCRGVPQPDGTSEHDVLVKRVIATAGQTVDLQDGRWSLMAKHSTRTTTGMSWPLSVQAPGAQVSYPYTVPDGCVWVMGDNRENSADSRYFGPVDGSDLIAVALVRYWPLNRIGSID